MNEGTTTNGIYRGRLQTAPLCQGPAGVLLSQCISNVPAAILLSGFTDAVRPLLFGVNVGGLGTLIASMASVISYRAYAELPEAKSGTYMMVFTLYNLIFLIIMCAAGWMLLSL